MKRLLTIATVFVLAVATSGLLLAQVIRRSVLGN